MTGLLARLLGRPAKPLTIPAVVRIVAWSVGHGFGDWHVELPNGRTCCGIVLPVAARFDRKQISLETAPRDACIRCWESHVTRSLAVPALL